MKYLKKQILHERKVKDQSFVLNADGSIDIKPLAGKEVRIDGNLTVTGNSPGATNQLVYYVSLEGNDSNTGTGAGPGQAKRTVKAAVDAAPAGATIQVAPGDYYEENPITLKARQTVRGDSLRNTQIYPKNNTETIFFMDNACYLFQLTFRGLRDPGWCAEIKPNALVTVSPYVQNCTNMNGPWLNDGTEFIPFETVQIEGVNPGARPIENDPSVPLGKRVNTTGGGNGMLVDGNQYHPDSLVKSFVADAFTQIAQGGIGFHITNEGYTQIVSCFSVFTRVGFQATKGGYLSISNSVSDFGTYAIIADGVFDNVFTTARPIQDYYSSVGSISMNNTGSNYTTAPTVVIDPPLGDINGVTATGTASLDATTGQITAITITDQGSGYDRVPNVSLVGGGYDVIATATANLVTNQVITVNGLRDIPQTGSIITFEGDSQGYYVTNTNITTQPFIYNESVCRRDVRRIVDAVVGDLALGTNYQSLAAGRSYLRARANKVIAAQLAPTIYGIEAARDEMLARIPDSDPLNEDSRYFIIERFAEIVSYLNQGDSTAAPDIDLGTNTLVDEGTRAAADNIVANKDFIVNELTNYISSQFSNLSYNQAKCERDTELLVEAIGYDLATGSNVRTIFAALSYARANASKVSSDIQYEVSKATFENTRDSILAISAVSGSPTAVTRVNNLFTEFLDIFAGLNFNKDKCERDIGYVVDSVAWDVILNTNYNAVTTGLSYQRAPSAYVLSSQFQQTIRTYQYMKDIASNTYMTLSNTAVTRSEAAFDEIIDIISNADSSQDANVVDAITYTDPGVDVNKRYARELLQLNRDYIASELTTWIATYYPSLTYDSATCERDVKFITDAVCFDVQYGGNFATRRAADAYFVGTVSQLGSTDEVTATIDAYNELINIMQNIILETYSGQQVTTNPASSSEVDEVGSLVQIVIDVLEAGSTSALPSLTEPSIAHITDQNLIYAFNNWQDNMPAIKVDVLEEIDVNITNADTLSYPTPTGASSNLPNAVGQLVANRKFIQEEIAAYVNVNYPSVYDNGNGYNERKCKRDVGYIVDALAYDIMYGGNAATRICAQSYFVGTVNQLGTDSAEVTATIAAYERLQTVVSQIILEGAVVRSNGNDETQDTTGAPASGTQANLASVLVQIIIDVLNDGDLDNLEAQVLPDLTWASNDVEVAGITVYGLRQSLGRETTDFVLANYPSFTYDQDKCQRDVELILEAVLRDARLGTNHNMIVAAQAYKRATANYFNVNQNPATIMAMRYVRDTALSYVATNATATTRITEGFENFFNIVEYDVEPSEGTTYPSPTPASQERIDTARLLQDNKNFLIEETVLHINNQYFIYDSEKCRRDSGLILDGIIKDLTLGTNYWAVLNGLSYRRAQSSVVISDQLVETIAAVTRLKTQTLAVLSDSPSITAVSAAFDEVIDILTNGSANADALTWTSTGNNIDHTNARIQVQNNRKLIEDEVILWIRANEPTLVYNEATCRRDLGYIIDAISHDLNYNTNLATKEAAKAYFVGTTSQLPASQRTATGNAMEQLGSIAYDVILEAYSGQDTSGTAASATEAAKAASLANIIRNVVKANTLELLPADEALDDTWNTSNLLTSKTLIETNRTAILDDNINYINTVLNGFSYSEEKCRRDTGYLIDAVTHDVLYLGNRSTLIATRSYFDDGVIQIYGQTGETQDALEHLRDVAIQVVQGAAVVPEIGNPEPQNLTGLFGSSAESEEVGALFDIVITAISDSTGLETTPSNSNPLTDWIEVGLNEVCNSLENNIENIKINTITFITDNIISFSYNVEKCERDTAYIVDAAVYDTLFGGNKQTRRAAEAYYSNAVIAGQESITELSYRHLGEVLESVAQNLKVTASSGTTETQTYGTIGGSATSGAYANNMVNRIADVILLGGTTYLPYEIDHDYDNLGLTSLVKTQRTTILNDLQAIEDESIRLLNAEYGGVADLTLFPGIVAVEEGTLGSMQRVSTVSTSGHAFEYVGAGITYNALPFFGGSPIAANEFVETNNGKVFAGGTVDQIGNFKVGNYFNVNALTGSITLNAEEINLSGIAAIGPFRRFGIPVGVELKEVSNNSDLTASTGTADINTVPTQTAVINYLTNRYLNKLTGGTVEADVVFETDIAVDGGDITTTSTVVNLFNDNASFVNFAGGATSITIGANGVGTTEIRHDVIVGGSLDIGGNTTIVGDVDITIPDELQQAFNITMNTEDYITIDTRDAQETVAFGSVPVIRILNTSQSTDKSNGSLVVSGGLGVGANLNVGGDIFFEGSIVSTNSSNLSLFNDTAGTVDAFGDATEIQLGSSGIIPGNFIVNNDYIRFTSNYNMKIPTGTTGERGSVPEEGYIRFNTDLGIFEGYDGIAWNTLGGVRDVDGNTYIEAESSPGSNENELSFVTDGLERMNLSTTGFTLNSTITSITFEGTTQSNSPDSGLLVIEGGMGIEKNLNVRGDLRVYNNTLLEGNLTATGTTVLGTADSVVDSLTVYANSVFNVYDNTVQAFEILEGTNSYFKITTTNADEQAIFDTPIVKVNNTTASTDSATGALVVAGGVGIGGSLYVDGGFTVGGSIAFGDDPAADTFTVQGTTDFTIPDNTASAFVIDEGTSNYLNIATTDGSELITIGTVPQVFIGNVTESTDKDTGALVVDGGVGIEKSANIGLDLNVGRNTVITGDLGVNGGDLTTTSTTFNLINTTATTVNAFGDATAINIGAATGILTISNEQTIFDSVTSIQLPVGDTSQRPTAATGQVRFNSQTQVFEGYDGIAWGSLGGVKDVDQDTYIRPETAPGADNDELEFYTAGILRATLGNTYFNVETGVISTFADTTESYDYLTGAVVINGGVGIGKNLSVRGYVTGNESGVLQLTNLASDKILVKADTIESPEEIKWIANAPDSSVDAVVYPITLAHHSVSGIPVAGSGTGLAFELETTGDNFEVGGSIDVIAQDVTTGQEDFDMVFKTMEGGATATEKLRLSEVMATFATDVTLNQNLFVSGILDAASFRGSIVSDDSTLIVDAINNTITTTSITATDLTLTTDLEVQHGGTGRSSFVPNGILYGDGTNQIAVTDAAGSADISTSFQLLTVTDSGDDTPVWTDTLDGGSFGGAEGGGGVTSDPDGTLVVGSSIRYNGLSVVVAKETIVSSASQTAIDAINYTTYRSSKMTIQITDTVSGEYQLSEVMVLHDGTNAFITTFGTIFTGSAPLASFDADLLNADCRILATGATANQYRYKIQRTSMTV